MKWRWLLPLLLLCLSVSAQTSRTGLQASSPEATVSVHGTVVDSLTGKPLDAVHVMLTESDAEPSIVYGAMSNAQGRFSIPDIPPEKYTVRAEKRGFILVPDRKKSTVTLFGELQLQLKAGVRPADLVLPMVVRAIIAGRVLDEHGDPLTNARVVAMSVNRETGASVQTNGRGEFRLSVPPGKYTVEGSKWSMSETTENPLGSRPESGYVHTYYPGVMGIGGATVVEAFAGRVLNGVEIRLVRPAAFRVRGEITGLPNGDRSLMLFWQPAGMDKIGQDGWESGRLDFSTQQAQATGAGSSVKFASSPLGTGTYHFYAVCCGNEEFQSQIAEVTLTDSDVTGITLALAPGAEITGRVALAGGLVVPPGPGISVELRSEELHRWLQGQMGKNGSFSISNVFPDRYRLEVGQLPEDAYVRSVELNGAAMQGMLLDLSGGAEGVKLKIVVSANGARITGQVRKAKVNSPALQARVLLFPEHEGSVDKEECQDVMAGETGTYSFQGLAPGHYRLITRPSYTRDECEQAVAAMRQGLIAAERVELKAGEKLVKNIQLVDEVSDDSHP